MRIVLASWGTYGDLFPTLGLAIALRARGHRPIVAAPAYFAADAARLGLPFRAIRPDVDPTDRAKAERFLDPVRGPEALLKDELAANVRASFADLLDTVRGADAVLSHPVTFAAPLAAEAAGVPWISSVLAPISFFSAWDPPLPPPAPWLARVARLGRPLGAALRWASRRHTRPWLLGVEALRRELGLREAGHPFFEGQFSPLGTLALFSPALAQPQPDWAPGTEVTGYVRYNGEGTLGAALERFLDAGPAPVVFTLGTSAVWAAGEFYRESTAAAASLGLRAVLLVGRDPRNRPAKLPPGILAVESAPHRALFPRAAAVVHQAGSGTLGEALCAGVPMLICPHGNDQPDNAERARRLGVARVIYPSRYRADRAAAALDALLGSAQTLAAARAVGGRVCAEDGTARACEGLERLVRSA